VCKKLIKNSQPFGKKSQKTGGGVDSHCIVYMLGANCQGTHPTNSKRHASVCSMFVLANCLTQNT